MGRSPCCEKVGLKKGPWTPEEDQKLLAYIEEHGHGSWRALPAKAGLQRCGKSCRLRWTNYLRPDIKRGKFSLQEEQTIIQLHALLGNRWSAIATHLPKRTDNEIKNYWNTHLKKRLTKMGIDPVTHKPKTDALSSGSGNSKNAANLSHMAQWESARLEAEARLVRESKLVVVSNPVQSQTQTQIQTQLINKNPPPTCIDVLKAWQGVWSKSVSPGMFPIGCGDLESPTSTLSFADHTVTIPNVVFNESTVSAALDFAKNSVTCEMDNTMSLQDMNNSSTTTTTTTTNTTASAWLIGDSFRAVNENDMQLSNIMEGFTDIFGYSCEEHNTLMGGGDSLDNGDKSCGGNFEENNKNYWNSILYLVNASSSGSPVF
ncbi:hypothetical protein CMV_007748 [Castanea mollissima]|uniref:Uncharacterized protein n=1 Tax=Castanea mollissima TaxID=60419 RepID=A0A8J4RMQ7_9ROSI|nr:hypothetical protein CMV_007748 [Castanea mollissima]